MESDVMDWEGAYRQEGAFTGPPPWNLGEPQPELADLIGSARGEVLDAIYAAYFENGRDIGDLAGRSGVGHGLDDGHARSLGRRSRARLRSRNVILVIRWPWR